MDSGTIVPAFDGNARLKRKLRQHLAELGFQRHDNGMLRPPSSEKSVLRAMHGHQREQRLNDNLAFVRDNLKIFESVIAEGSEIDPSCIDLELQKIDAGSQESILFRMAALTWSVPVSNGFGRRLRYLVWDKYHGRLVGLIALGDPVFNLGVRDREIDWNANERAERLVNVLDAYVLGALPPYSHLLVGKAVACLVRTRDVYDDFLAKYGSTSGLISGKKKRARLLLVTTSSSLGRSSVYNRLKLQNQHYFRSIGYTKGWGHFHISDELVSDLRQYLRQSGHPYVNQNRFGQGPNWKLRMIREGLKALGLSEDTLHHGVKREVFICEMVDNSLPILKSGRGQPALSDLSSVADVAASAAERWILPRSTRRPEFRHWRKQELIASLLVQNQRERAANADRTTLR